MKKTVLLLFGDPLCPLKAEQQSILCDEKAL